MTLIASHFEQVQRRLEAEGNAAKSFSHGMNRGLIREAFIREFIAQNISDYWGIGTGEIIHEGSSTQETQNQIDVVIHNKRFPKLSLATGIDLFFVETVSSFIEVKSTLKKDDLRRTAATTKNIKNNANFPRQRMNPTGLVMNPRSYSIVFAYDGPKKIETVQKWLKEISEEDDYGIDGLRGTEPDERGFFNHSYIDGVFVLGRGYVYLDSLPFRSQIADAIDRDLDVPSSSVWVSGKDNELLFLWALLNEINARLMWGEAQLLQYIGRLAFNIYDD